MDELYTRPIMKRCLNYLKDIFNGKANKATTLSGYGITNAYTKDEVNTALATKQNVLTFDNVPTTNSNNPVTSQGIKTAIDGVANINTMTNPKNLLCIHHTYTTGTMDDVAYTINLDADTNQCTSIVFNGTSAGSTSGKSFNQGSVFLPKGTYILSGAVADKVKFSLSYSGTIIEDEGEGVEFTLNQKTLCSFYIRLAKNETFENLTVYPMIRPTGTDNSFVPYAPTNMELSSFWELHHDGAVPVAYYGGNLTIDGNLNVKGRSNTWNILDHKTIKSTTEKSIGNVELNAGMTIQNFWQYNEFCVVVSGSVHIESQNKKIAYTLSTGNNLPYMPFLGSDGEPFDGAMYFGLSSLAITENTGADGYIVADILAEDVQFTLEKFNVNGTDILEQLSPTADYFYEVTMYLLAR